MNTAYRVWDGEQMHYWDDEGLSLTIEGENWYLYGKDTEFITSNKTAHTALMWGTGLKDKNGKVIYDKDITEESYTHPMSKENIIDRYVIERKNGFDRMDHVSKKEGFYRHLWLRSDEVKVIGNVFENPELLEGVE
ncbi:YopX family protein [Bacillus spizizenii]|uniref:YopX family protein n=1 Tax=Bacillus inaquosorum TaxID=483913 RepID=UPI00227E25E1|nr:YopX family protein [Bacillus inaquosorum]MCY7829869.1 YopX family protein [Bacillus spizizenii]MCY7839727.1 YopX family protein [Bacillus spizizenii]MCY8706777.1 YopX family protein [Bacillus inaquosorum]